MCRLSKTLPTWEHLSCGVVCAAAFNWFLKITSVTSMDNQNIQILRVNSSLDNFYVLLARVVQLHRLTAPSPRKEARVTRHKRSTLKSTLYQRQMEHHQTREFVMWNIISHSFWSLSVWNTFLTRFMNPSVGTTDVTDTFQASLSWNTVLIPPRAERCIVQPFLYLSGYYRILC